MLRESYMKHIILFSCCIVLAFLTQALGYTNTCTQGDPDPWITGTVLSFPFLAVLIGFSVASFFGRQKNRTIFEILAYVIAILGCAAILAMNAELVKYILVLGVNACGPDYGPKTGDDNIIVFGYGILPSATLLCLLASILKWMRQLRE
jgi:hypothetical protein